MTLQVVGAGLARTGTSSLKLALERLLGGPCYHMATVFANPAHIRVWHDAIGGRPPEWTTFLAGYRAATDLPASAFWKEFADLYPDALIVLSVRASADAWWDSWSNTILAGVPTQPPAGVWAEYMAMVGGLLGVLGAASPADKAEMTAAYERHNDAVRASAPPGRLLEWQATDGWAPLAERLGLPVPDEPFPRVNTRETFAVPEFGVLPEWARGQ